MHNSNLHLLLARARADELMRAAAATRRGSGRPGKAAPVALGDRLPVTIRYAFPDDAVALARLAALDSADVPAGPLLVAEVEGELRAALSLSGGGVVADPFHRTSLLLELLLARAAQLARVEPGPRLPRLARLRLALPAWSRAWR